MLRLNLKKKEILFCLSFASTFNLYLFDFLSIKNYFFIPIIYQDSHQLFLYSILFMFFIFFIALLLFHYSANNYTIKKIIILLLSVLTFEIVFRILYTFNTFVNFNHNSKKKFGRKNF